MHAQVRAGWVPLNGEVEWDYQRREVKRMARNVRGVVGIPSTIAVTAAASAPGIASVGSHLAISRGTHGRGSGRQPWDSGLNGSEPRFADDDGLPKPPRCRGSYPGGCWARWRKARASRSWPSRSPWSIAVVVFIHGAHALVLAPHGEPFAVHDHRAVNSATFIVVILELVGTIVARPEEGGFQLQPFLMIGIISATRDILTVDAELSLAGDQQAPLAHDDRTRRQRRGGGRAVGRPGAGARFRAPQPCLRAIP